MQDLTIIALALLLASAHCFISCKQDQSRLQQSLERSAIATTTIVIPRYFPGEIPEGSYPSPLHKIHVIPVLSKEETAACLQIANAHAGRTGCWNKPDRTRHAAYSTCDFPVEDCDDLQTYLEDIGFHERLFGHLEDFYGVCRKDMDYLDFFVANYISNTPGTFTTMDRLEAHRDGSILSFTITLSDPSDFEGGGTFFDALKNVEVEGYHCIVRENGVVRPNRAGDAVFHSGKLLHGADVVFSGSRTVMVGFIDVMDWWIKPGILSQACTEWGRLDVAMYRWKRIMKKTKKGKAGWFLNNSRWHPEESGRSPVQGYYPAAAFRNNVKRRANKEYQRMKRLETEDKLLRAILESKDSSVVRQSELHSGYEIVVEA
jgi:hypothetical protein